MFKIKFKVKLGDGNYVTTLTPLFTKRNPAENEAGRQRHRKLRLTVRLLYTAVLKLAVEAGLSFRSMLWARRYQEE